MYMNAVKNYQTVEKETISGRATEARVLTKAAQLLLACQKEWDAPDLRGRLDHALTFNQKIWTIFQVELANPNNPLPLSLRQAILQLGRYIDKKILEAYGAPAPEKLDMIIKINQNLAAGLRGSTSDDDASAE